ncbi:MAG: T9SS type A sorting domain-containing protein [Candidatus Hatepunaea meridiana]|nr:T9SS type A sorting domain-containing protein [Candidatus Hatepunaea meridiana]
MKSIRILVLAFNLCFIITTVAMSELPLDEIWSVDLDSAVALGNAWVDEDGNSMALVGDGWRALLVSEGEIIWSSDSLAGTVTALARIPYSDGEQIVVAASEPVQPEEANMGDTLGFGFLFRFGSDELEQLSELRLLEYWIAYDYLHDYRNLTKLTILPDMLEAEEHPVLAAWNIWWWGHFSGGHHLEGFIGIITDETFSTNRIGVPVELAIFQDAEDNTIIATGWHTWQEDIRREFSGNYTCGVTLLNADLSIVNSLELAEYSFSDDMGSYTPDRRPELLGMTVVQSDDQISLFVAYSDSSHAFISEMSVPDLDVIRTRALPDGWRGGQMLSFQWETLSNLLLIDSQGNVLVFDSETLFQIGDGALPQPYVASIQTDFEGDGDPELVTLSRDRLVCYSIAPLVAPYDRFVLHPSSLILLEPYPNPFNAQTKIGYQIPEICNVTIRLYDLRGRQIAELVNANHTPGRYSVTYHTQDLASGIYMVKMTSDSKTMVRKLVLMR